MLLSAVEHEVSDTGLLQSGPGATEHRAEAEVISYFSCVISLLYLPCDETDDALKNSIIYLFI